MTTLEQRECIWNIPESERHCEFCTANCNKVPTISTTTAQTLEQAAVEWSMNNQEGFCTHSMKIAAFKAGAEWQKQRMAEWLTEQKEQTSIGLSAYDMGEENGKIDMLGRAIQKLEEL